MTIDVASILSDHKRRVERIKAAGGIAKVDVWNGTAVVPPGWQYDAQTYFFVPPYFSETVQ